TPHLGAEAVRELPAEILVPQRDAVAHVVEHGLHDFAGALHVVARLFGCLLGGRERLFAFLQRGHVAAEGEQAAIVEGQEIELDVSSFKRAAQKAVATRLADQRDALPYFLLDILDWAEVAALHLK